MNSYLVFILAVIVVGYLIESVLSTLNMGALKPELPSLFKDVYDEEKYTRSQEYTGVTTRFSLVQDSISTVVTILFIVMGGFNLIDTTARSMGFGTIGSGLVFMGLLMLLSGAAGLPFSIYSTFVIEARFGFNTTTPKTYLLDIIKSLGLSALLGAPLVAFIIWFFESTGSSAWLYCWGATVLFVVVVQFVAPVLFLPLFNKFTPLEAGELHDAIMAYAHKERFKMKGIYTIDGSRRSTKLNAYFTGFGKFRRIVFFDTLVDKLDTEEIVGVLAHEMGHFKLKHIFKMLAASTLQTGLMFYVLSLFLNNRGLFDAFGMEHVSVYGSLIFFGFLFSPISTVLSLVFNVFSRKHEYQADEYARQTLGTARHLISALKKLSVANLSNLTPHPWYVAFHYSHPPLLQRLEAMLGADAENAENPGAPKEKCELCGQQFPAEQLAWNDDLDQRLCGHCAAEEKSCGCSDE